MEHGAGTGENLVNGNAGARSEEGLGRSVVMGGMEDEERGNGATMGEPAATENTAALGSAAEEDTREDTEGVRAEEEGIYL